MKSSRSVGGAIAAVVGVAWTSISWAAVPPPALQGEEGLVLASGARVPPYRAYVAAPAPAMTGAWQRFARARGPGWAAWFDRETGVPARIWGGSIPAPGASASAEAAEAHARALLREHGDLLAPGAAPEDFQLAGNHFDGRVRTVGFVQRHGGRAVLEAQVSFRFLADRLYVIASDAQPIRDLPAVEVLAAHADVAARARGWVASDFGETARVQTVAAEPVILGVRSGSGLRHALVREVKVRTERPVGLWSVYVDAGTGVPVARRQRLMFAQGSVRFNAPERYPAAGRRDYPAFDATLQVDGQAVETDGSGVLAWSAPGSARITAQPVGPLVAVKNQAGATASTSFNLAPGGAFAWNEGKVELEDAQLTAYVATQRVKAYARQIAPTLDWLDAQIHVNVNLDESCNAYSDGDSTNFFRSSSTCENSARIVDVVAHEFGHTVHAHAIIPGVGAFDTPLSEGGADYLAATMLDDPAMGRGFFYDDRPVRNLDQGAKPKHWPEDVESNPHLTGLIFGGAMWDLRTALATAFGHDAGVRLADRFWFAVLQRASDIPSSYVEVLAADDDDGKISDGTPHFCAIRAAFGRHGLATDDGVDKAVIAACGSSQN